MTIFQPIDIPFREHALAYYARHNCALFPIPYGSKNPTGIISSFAHDHSSDPEQWNRWYDLHHCNFGLVAGPSNLLVADIDISEVGRHRAWAIWADWWASRNLSVPQPHVQSARGGWHALFALPPSAPLLRQVALIGPTDGSKKAIVDLRVGNGFVVAAGSYYDGTAKGEQSGPYLLMSNDAPHPVPSVLIEHCRRSSAAHSSSIGVGTYDLADVSALVQWLTEKDAFAAYEDWLSIGMALRVEAGDAGLATWRLTFDDTVTDDTVTTKWNSFATRPTANSVTLATWMQRARKMGWTGSIRKSTSAMFSDVAQIISPHLVPSIAADAMLGTLPDHPELTAPQADAISRFWAHLPSGKILEETSRTFYIAGSVDKHVGRIKDYMKTGPGVQASTWLSQHRYVDSVGWDPDKPMIVEDRIFVDEWIPAPGKRTFNLYLPSAIVPVEGDASAWLNHIKTLYPNEAEHILRWCAHRVQRPGEKVNHGLVFIGEPGIGKDIAIDPVIAAVGAQNFKSISAKDFFKSDFNAYLESVLLRIDEVHDLGGESKYAFHDRLKTVMAAPPASHYINAKHVPHHSARNVCGVILTSNHTDALYIDPLDRRHFVCISERKKADFPEGYFDEFGEWLASGGNEAVAYLLANLDISAFRAKGEPPKTAGWHRIVAAGMAPESGELGDVIDALGKPAALTLWDIRMKTDASGQLSMMLNDPKQSRNLPRRLAECGYVKVLKPDTKDGRWRMESQKGRKTDIYARQDMNEVARIEAARARASWMPSPPPL